MVPGRPPLKLACGMRFTGSPPGSTAAGRAAPSCGRSRPARRLVEGARVLVRPVHADGELGEHRRVEGVEQGVHVADGVDLVLGRHLRPAAGRAEDRHAARALLVAELQPPVERRVRARRSSPRAAPGRCGASPARSGRCSCTRFVPVGSVAFGIGNRFSSAWPFGSIRLAGMMLPGKHAGPPLVVEQFPVSSGSRM